MGIRKLLLPLFAVLALASYGPEKYTPIKTYDMHPNVTATASAQVGEIKLPDSRVLRHNSGYDGQQFALGGKRTLPVGYELQGNHRVDIDNPQPDEFMIVVEGFNDGLTELLHPGEKQVREGRVLYYDTIFALPYNNFSGVSEGGALAGIEYWHYVITPLGITMQSWEVLPNALAVTLSNGCKVQIRLSRSGDISYPDTKLCPNTSKH